MDLALYALVEAWAKYLALRFEHNLWLYNCYTPVELLLKGSLAVAVVRERWPRAAMIALISGYVFLHSADRAANAGSGELLVRSTLASTLLLALFYTYLLFRLAEDETKVLYQRPEFVLFLGFTLYNGGMVPLVGLLTILNERDIALADRLYVINDILYLVSHLAIIFAAWRFRHSGSALWTTPT